MKKYGLICMAMGLASGIGFRSFFNIDSHLLGLLFVLLALLSVLLAVRRLVAVSHLLCGLVVLFFVIIGVIRFESAEASNTSRIYSVAQYESREVEVRGRVVRDVERTERGYLLYVETTTIESESVRIILQVRIEGDAHVAYGDMVVVRGTLKRPHAFESEVGRVFLYEEYLHARNVTHTLSFAKIESYEPLQNFSVFRVLYASKEIFMHGIESVLPEPHAGFGEGLLLGEKHALGEKYEDIFRSSGIIHIVVLSGYNLAIVAEVLMYILARFFIPRTRVVLGIASLILFAIAVGLSATVVRAAIMAILVLVARAYGKTYFATLGLCFAGILMLLWNPYVLMFDPGFQLSFIATLGLIYVAPVLERYFTFLSSRYGFRECVVATVSTQMSVTPLLLFSMGTVSIISLFANALVLVVVPLAMFCVFVAGIGGVLFGSAAMVVGYPAYLILSYILFVAQMFASFPYAVIEVKNFSLFLLVMSYVIFIGAVVYLFHKKIPRTIL
jgi:competence protein ComEC